jgi:hypothetical protein
MQCCGSKFVFHYKESRSDQVGCYFSDIWCLFGVSLLEILSYVSIFGVNTLYIGGVSKVSELFYDEKIKEAHCKKNKIPNLECTPELINVDHTI